jgi:hypothetical protein
MSRSRNYDVGVAAMLPSPAVLELLEWISPGGRGYSETLEAWKTHCPRLTVWEDALAAGLVEVRRNGGDESQIAVTSAGRSALHDAG